MTEQFFITPPPELVYQWHKEACKDPYASTFFESKTLKYIAARAAQWSADTELNACCEYLVRCAQWEPEDVTELRTARRPKPPSLKEKALDSYDRLVNEAWCKEIDHDLETVRHALEQLND